MQDKNAFHHLRLDRQGQRLTALSLRRPCLLAHPSQPAFFCRPANCGSNSLPRKFLSTSLIANKKAHLKWTFLLAGHIMQYTDYLVF